MKVNVCYNVSCVVDIPENEVKNAFACSDHFESGHLLNLAAQKHNTILHKALESDELNSEITGVYNPCKLLSDGRLIWENDDYDEVIWES